VDVGDTICPKCGAQQDEGTECLRCGIIFARYRPSRRPGAEAGGSAPPGDPDHPDVRAQAGEPAVAGPVVEGHEVAAGLEAAGGLEVVAGLDPSGTLQAPPSAGPADPGSSRGPFRRFYRVARWVVLGVSATVLLLILRTASPPRVKVDAEAPRRLQWKLQSLAADAGSGMPHALEIDEAELNSWMQTNLALAAEPAGRPPASAGSQHPASTVDLNSPTNLSVPEAQSNVRDVKLHMEGDQVTAYVLFHLYGKDLSLTLDGSLSVQNGYLRLSPTSMWLGSLPIPRTTVDRAVGALFDSPDNREQFRVPEDIRDMRVKNGELVITYR